MSNLRIKKSFLKQVKVRDVMEELRANSYFLKSHHEMMACVKDTLAYKQMQEVAVKHMFKTLESTYGLPDAEAREEKKNQIARIGHLALEINSSISKTISERLGREAIITAKKALKRLSDKRSECSVSVSNRGRKRNQNGTTINEGSKQLNEDMESDVSLNGISESVSSVHTSDLSSFDDEIVVSSEDESGVKNEKRISFKTANKAYFDDEFSKISNAVCRNENKSEVSRESVTQKKSLSNASNKFVESKNSAPRPKRERKPNSRYSE